MIFSGHPGTGKTMMGRMMGNLLKPMGILTKGARSPTISAL